MTTKPSHPWLGIAAACAGTPLAYAIVRVVQYRLSPEPDPGAVIWAEHSPALSRLSVTVFLAAMMLVATLAIAQRGRVAIERVLVGLAIASTMGVLVQTWLRP